MMTVQPEPSQATTQVGRLYVHLVALEQDRDPGSFENLQEVIDAANDHNQTMLDAMSFTEPALERFVRDHDFDESTYDVLSWCFDQASVYVESLKDLRPGRG